MILICGAFLGSVVISFGENDRFIDPSAGGSVCLCVLGNGEAEPSHDPLELCEECHDPSPQILVHLGGQPQDGIRAGVFLDLVRLENSLLPEGPYLDQIEPPLI